MKTVRMNYEHPCDLGTATVSQGNKSDVRTTTMNQWNRSDFGTTKGTWVAQLQWLYENQLDIQNVYVGN